MFQAHVSIFPKKSTDYEILLIDIKPHRSKTNLWNAEVHSGSTYIVVCPRLLGKAMFYGAWNCYSLRGHSQYMALRSSVRFLTT